ncbi:tetratricopeptide repeat protein [Sphingosinicella sp. BN140058]|uniref:tetratricopeptide repeat protein n=1 Tax=Sphingosinicella sp. BN140058 TaxID=1892855 RepID=UPI001011CB07|nr:tetratricopeptide repeat protein [Sphingosinicella sp. BN140058]QAY78605.1 tetratricopeptide repeat protein [Sphingosinicella sp. BN140058]
MLAARALEEAIVAGNHPLAVRAATILDRAGAIGPDGRLVLLADAVRRKDWKRAGLQADRMAEDKVFAFTAPLFHAWIAVGSGKGDPLAPLAAAKDDPLATAYGGDLTPLLLIAQGNKKDGLAALAPFLARADGRSDRLRLAAAALLARKNGRKEALALVAGDNPAYARPRTFLERKQPLFEGDIAAAGIASLLVRISNDLRGQEVPALALSIARIATFVAPQSSETWLSASELLAGRDQKAALAALDHIAPNGLLGPAAMDRRLTLLVESGGGEEALDDARRATQADPGSVTAWARLGDLLGGLNRNKEAAEAYGEALKAAAAAPSSSTPAWTLWLLRGSALTRAGDWAGGKFAAERAYALAPQHPVVLNFLGYSQLERRENIEQAEQMIRQASKLDPDNASITDSLGWAHYVRGDYPKAIELLERAARGEPSDAAINEHLGDAYYSAGRRFEARYAWQAALVYAEDDDASKRIRSKLDLGLKPELAAP